MSRRTRDLFEYIHSEGGLLPPDLLKRIAEGDKSLPGLSPESYHLAKGERLNEMINRSWNRLLGAWASFREAGNKLAASAADAGITRDRWLSILFQELGYGQLEATPKAREIEGKTYPISRFRHASPIHLIGFRTELGVRTKGVRGAATQSPHSLVQEFLNRSDDHLWGFLSNGLQLRILRDNVSLTRQAYVEIDLEGMMEGEAYADFSLLWLLAHQSRVEPRARAGAGGDDVAAASDAPAPRPEECWLEQWSRVADEQGTRIREDLRKGVQMAIEALGQGFLAWPKNDALREVLRTGELDKQDYYRELLRLVYRLLFLFVAEDRDLLLLPEADTKPEARQRYDAWYSTRRLRGLAERRRGSTHADLYQGLRVVMEKLGSDAGCLKLALPALGSFLWSREAVSHLAEAGIANRDLLEAVRALAFTEKDRRLRAVDYRNLGSEELGSVYESLLELQPDVDTQAHHFQLRSVSGSERKTTGSYYTPTSLIQCLLESALDPVLDEACQKQDAEQAILALKVCDPACGSGHFLIAAAHRMARRLAAVRTGEDEPAPEAQRTALRDVIGRCLYGVDMNPDALELCKMNLWLEALEPGKPLSFLDSHIQCGNSLLGTTPALMADGIPDHAWKPIEGDDKQVASALKKRNREQRSGQTSLFGDFAKSTVAAPAELARAVEKLESIPDDSAAAIHEKENHYRELAGSLTYRAARLRADAWCAAFVWRKTTDSAEPPTEDLFQRLAKNPDQVPGPTRDEINRLARQYQFFHWHLAFPSVFFASGEDSPENEATGWSGGFDVVLANPPWDRIKLQEKEFFATRLPAIAEAPNAAARRRSIAKLQEDDPGLYAAFLEARRAAEGASHFVRDSGRFPLCGRGDVNTYSVFAEWMRTSISATGRVGCIVPSGIATDDTTKLFFQDLVEQRSLASLYHFENEEHIFQNVHHAFRFCLLSLVGADRRVEEAEFAFFLRQVNALADEARRFPLSAEDIALINPNTRTCPIFRTRRDAKITKQIYHRVPVLLREGPPKEDPWGVSFKRLFDMSNDSHLFRTREQLAAEGWKLEKSTFARDDERYLPLYEAKMIHHFDHRFGTYEGQTEAQANQGKLPELDPDQHADPHVEALPRYWVPATEVESRLADRWSHGWLLGWRDITGTEKVRTVIASIIPRVGVGNNLPISLLTASGPEAVCLAACISSFAFDFIARFKVGGTHLNFFIANQLPVLAPAAYDQDARWHQDTALRNWIEPRVLELTYTAWDLAPFAEELGYEGPPFRWDEGRRFLLRCELDAAFFHLYGIPRDDVAYIMDTFPIVKRKDEKQHGEYRTKRVILEVCDAMQRAIDTGQPYQSLLEPLPADPGVAHLESADPDRASVDEHRSPPVPVMPDTAPIIDSTLEPLIVVWAILYANGGEIGRSELARAFALRSQPALTTKLAPEHLATTANDWANKVGQRNVADGSLKQALDVLADRGGITLTTDEALRSMVTTSAHTPGQDEIDAWYRFEARLVLAVLAALPPAGLHEVDAGISGDDRSFLESEGA